MIENVTAKMSPTMVRNIKIGAVVVGVVAATVVVGVILVKTGAIGNAPETAEEIIDAALAA